ncbi:MULTISPECIES: hypothetical protein [unclassified Bradyrhizobium]|uniref:hypothetical protein n=1 Tax=unclassified Bradyrhizobium TaxID=2631580 RepID=UPI001FFB3E2E|nr:MULTISPECIES: hypothetical protein [unclassified Bradyrhizobium]MCK1711038.1 hypothetical protein [Bradyrhizobium sp. 143]MCK1729563.1 hypothetical protein [Bradyrhizobium sp. 142]
MKLVTERPFADPEVAARQLVQLASSIEPVQDGRIHIEKINYPFLYTLKGSGTEFGAGIDAFGIARRRILISKRESLLRSTGLLAVT